MQVLLQCREFDIHAWGRRLGRGEVNRVPTPSFAHDPLKDSGKSSDKTSFQRKYSILLA
jgi:hypothetical protein